MSGGTKCCIAQHGHEGTVQAVDRGHTSDLGIGHALRDDQCRNREASQKVRLRKQKNRHTLISGLFDHLYADTQGLRYLRRWCMAIDAFTLINKVLARGLLA